MEENLSENLYIGSIASKFFISPQHLIRTFKEVTGYNPKEYITKQRIKKAMHLLNTDHLEVADVAEMVGYTSITQFYKAFKYPSL